MKSEPGKSGNPNGRPRGSGDPTTRVRRALSAHAAQLSETLLAEALKGDIHAAGWLLLCFTRNK